jgi:GIY-YIG catalytic domain
MANERPIMGIYVVTCLVTGGQYVGQSRNIHRRWEDHRSLLKNGQHGRKCWQDAWNEHGEDWFTWEVLEEVSDAADLYAREDHYIEGLNPTFNHGPLNVGGREPRDLPARLEPQPAREIAPEDQAYGMTMTFSPGRAPVYGRAPLPGMTKAEQERKLIAVLKRVLAIGDEPC